MSKISKRVLNKEIEERIFSIFWETIAKLRSPSEAESFFEDLLSPPEQIMLAKRLSIAVLLKKGYTYDQIDNTLKVSRPTIMNVSIWMKHKGIGYKKAVEKVLAADKKEEFFDKIEEFLLQLETPAKFGSVHYSSKQQRGKDLYKRKLRRSVL